MAKSVKKSAKRIRAERQQAQQSKQRKRTFIILGVLGLLVGAYFLFPRTEAPEVAVSRLENQPSMGSVNAKVVLTEFGDFTCSACRSWHQAGIVEQLLLQYGDVLRVEWRDFPVITADSPRAAEAGQCAYDQGLFWEFLDRVYQEPGSSYTNAGETNLQRFAADVGLDSETFNTCLDTYQHQNTVAFDLEAARELRLPGTPAFLVNGEAVIGANPQILTQAIESALNANP
jgi:protein-disulfide isomerase